MSLRPNLPGGDGRRLGAEAMSRLRRKSAGVIDDGLSDDEFARIEETFGFQFADDHRAFLAAGLPVNSPATPPEPGVAATSSQPWPDWRHHDHDELRRRLERPVNGVLFDVENNHFWATSWGKRPDRVEQATEIARRALTQAPAMIPIYRHRYLPAGTGTYGHPVLSMWQTDIIYYGLDIADYIDREFADADRPPDRASWNPHATVTFWKDLI